MVGQPHISFNNKIAQYYGFKDTLLTGLPARSGAGKRMAS
jgi:hypothetical protein